MISFIEGILGSTEPGQIVVQTGGIGFLIYTSDNSLRSLPAVGEEVRIYTYLYVKEDILALYGFTEPEELDIFKLLITVNGVGPKAAVNILSHLSVSELITAVITGDVKGISGAQNIGKKTAEKIILEMKDKFKAYDHPLGAYPDAGSVRLSSSDTLSPNAEAAIEGIALLGFSRKDAIKAVKIIEGLDEKTADEIINEALTII